MEQKIVLQRLNQIYTKLWWNDEFLMILTKLRLGFLVAEIILTFWTISGGFLTKTFNSWTLRGDFNNFETWQPYPKDMARNFHKLIGERLLGDIYWNARNIGIVTWSHNNNHNSWIPRLCRIMGSLNVLSNVYICPSRRRVHLFFLRGQ